MAAPARSGPVVLDDSIIFSLHDPDDAFEAVGLMQDLRRPRDWTPLDKDGDVWTVAFPRLDVQRMEYQFKGVHRDGGDEVFCDPANPERVPGVFGDKSVVLLPQYHPPAWLADPDEEPGGELLSTTLPSRTLRGDVPLQLWTSRDADAEQPLPLLIAHDGPEYAEFSSLIRFLDNVTSQGVLPPLRVALLAPPWPRDEHYSGSAAYARALATEILPALRWLAPTPTEERRYRVGMGASLGALSLLHVHRLRPATFGGLFLQSGSYFRQRFDKQESGFPRFRRISRFVGEVLAARDSSDPIPVVLTCGTVEENLANNRAVAAALERQGYPVTMVVNRDAHNYVGWRDTFDPHLADLLRGVWGAA